MIKEFIFSPDKPSFIREKWFHLLNISFFVLSSVALWFLKSELPLMKKRELPYANWWLALFALVVLYLMFKKSFKGILRFAYLTVYAQNRAIIFLVLLNIVYFPIELIIFTLMDNYQANGLGISTFVMKILSYAYFYFIFLKLIFLFVLPKSGKGVQAKE